MTESNQNVTINAGDSIVIEDSINNLDDISGYSAQFTLAEYRGGSVVAQYTDSDSQLSVASPTTSSVSVALDEDDTSEIGSGDPDGEDMYYEIELTDQNGNDYTVTTGTMTVLPSY